MKKIFIVVAFLFSSNSFSADIDKQYKYFFNKLLEKMSRQSKLVVPGTHMLFIAKNLERLGDHATNIADSISYMATGEVKAPSRPKISE